MCVYSNVLDHYGPLFPYPAEPAPAPTVPGHITIQPILSPLLQWEPSMGLTELRKLIEEFREAMQLAKRLDELMGHANCERAEKLKLMERVAELEKRVDEILPRGVPDVTKAVKKRKAVKRKRAKKR